MSDKQAIVVERTYRARVEELWALWTTKDGFASWWAPEGIRVEVHELDARVGGVLRYDHIAVAPEIIAVMRRLGRPASTAVRGRFSELDPPRRLAITHVFDFLPGVPPYESTMTVDFFPSGDRVRMVVTLPPVHDEEFHGMQRQGLTSQLRNLEARFHVEPVRDEA